MIQIVATAKPEVDPQKLIEALDNEVAQLAKKPPSADEVERAKNTREARFLSALQSLTTRAEQLAEYAVVAGDPRYLERDLARYRRVTPGDVQAVIMRYLGPGRVVLTVSPKAKHAP
jgi:zinc protease